VNDFDPPPYRNPNSFSTGTFYFFDEDASAPPGSAKATVRSQEWEVFFIEDIQLPLDQPQIPPHFLLTIIKEDGAWRGWVRGQRNVHVRGRTREEVIDNLTAALRKSLGLE
jgi:hypothetical protein